MFEDILGNVNSNTEELWEQFTEKEKRIFENYGYLNYRFAIEHGFFNNGMSQYDKDDTDIDEKAQNFIDYFLSDDSVSMTEEEEPEMKQALANNISEWLKLKN